MSQQQGQKTTVETPGAVALAPEDRAQMQKLTKLVAGYLEEMAEITSRTLKLYPSVAKDLQKVTITAGPFSGEKADAQTAPGGNFAQARANGSARVRFSDNQSCGVYQDPPGICRPCLPGE